MTLLANLATGSLGLRLQLPAEAEVSLDVVDAAEFTRAAGQSTWWLFHHSGMSMDISPTQFAGLQAHAEYYARAMFEDTSRTLAEDPAKPLRTKDPSWSPLVDFERIDLDGGPAVRSVHRMVYRAGREMMMGHLLVPLEDGLFEARVLTVDMRTGYRESALMLQFAEQDNVELPNLKIDPKRFDDSRHDETFEQHCLSRARASLHWLATEGALQIQRPGGHAAEQAEVQIPSEGCAVVPPPRFYPVSQADDAAAGTDFRRVSFCSTDGVERLMVHRHPLTRSRDADFQAWATAQSVHLYDDDPTKHAELSVKTTAVEISESRRDVLVRVEAPDQARVLLWWIDTDTPRPVYLALNTASAIPEDILATELEHAARSWRALPTKKPWWKPWA